MKKVNSLSLVVSFILFLRLPILPVMAAKPLSVIESIYGCSHYTLNKHGNSNVWCNATAGRKSVFINEYSASSYISNRKIPVAELTALDRRAGTISLQKVRHLLMLLFAG